LEIRRVKKKWIHILPFLILILIILIVYLTDFHKILSLQNLKKEQLRLFSFVLSHPLISPLIFISVYTISVSLVIPDSTILNLLGGMVFPVPLAIIYTCLSETLGALIFFTILRYLFNTPFKIKERPFFQKMRQKFLSHPSIYLLFLRLSHIIPFWLINASASYYKVRYWTFIWTCFVGVFPLAFLLAEAGHTISRVFAKPGIPLLGDIFTYKMKILLVLISLISFIPIAYKYIYTKIKKRKK
jgi:uncharacterized membrane protein YdjX (TVP38/TMEM64 family)